MTAAQRRFRRCKKADRNIGVLPFKLEWGQLGPYPETRDIELRRSLRTTKVGSKRKAAEKRCTLKAQQIKFEHVCSRMAARGSAPGGGDYIYKE